MKSVAVFASLLAAGVVAQPHGHKHGARFHGHEKRDMVTVIETEMEYVTVTEYIDDTTTTWITPDATTTVTASLSKAAPTTTEVPGQFFPGASSSSSSPSEPSSSAAPETTSAAPAVAPTTSVSVAPPASTPTTTPTPTTSSSAPTTTAAAPAASTAAASPAAQSSSGTSAPSGADVKTGDLTYYTLGLGACGVDDTGMDETKNIVALSHLLMGTQSNGNPMCGKTITISYGGKTTQATVEDKCMGCDIDSIDGKPPPWLRLYVCQTLANPYCSQHHYLHLPAGLDRSRPCAGGVVVQRVSHPLRRCDRVPVAGRSLHFLDPLFFSAWSTWTGS